MGVWAERAEPEGQAGAEKAGACNPWLPEGKWGAMEGF